MTAAQGKHCLTREFLRKASELHLSNRCKLEVRKD